MSESRPPAGVTHVHPTERLVAFRSVPPADKLRWLEEMREFLACFLTPERRVLLQHFRRGEL